LEQPKKPGVPPGTPPGPTRDIADLKARLGLAKPGPATAPVPAPGQGFSPSAPAAVPFGAPQPAMGQAAYQPAPMAPPAHDPYAAMKPPAGKQFDLRAVDDGIPAENVRSRGGKAGLVIGIILLVVGGAVGFGFGGAAAGRIVYNATNEGARKLKIDLDDIQKTVTQIGTAVSMSQQRLAAERKDAVAYDPKLIQELEQVKLDPRPDTARLFKVDYHRLPDLAVDRLMNYYYDTITLYGEVERHIKRTKADADALASLADSQAQRGTVNYGVVFGQGGKLVIGTLVEMGATVCKNGGNECPGDQIEGFQIRSNTGAPWSTRKIGAKPAGNIVVPIDHTPLFETAMSGSPDQVRFEQYKQRLNNIRLIVARHAGEKKELFEAVDKAAARADLFTLK